MMPLFGSKYSIIPAVILAIALFLGVAVYLGKSKDEPIFCTQEAKLCPDGSYVGRTGPRCEFEACPGASRWKTYRDQASGVSFKYPEKLPTTYISAFDWPPKVELEDGPFLCAEAGSEIDRAGKTEKRTINGREYCVTTRTEGAAGSIYSMYAYAAPANGKIVYLTFSTRSTQCANYPEPQMSACEAERQSFSLDPIMEEIVETINFE